jgi:glycosyltransferase involved in cell wall biosynthesis
MRILIATSHRGLWGGAEKYLQSVMPGLIERGHSLGLLYEYPSQAEGGIDSVVGGVPAWCSMELGVDSALRSLQTWAPDIVYSQGLDDSELERSLLDSYPVALYAHTYYGTCVSGRKCHASPRLEPCDRQFGTACLALYYPRRCGGLNPRTMWQLFELQSKRKSRLPDYRAVLVASRHMYREFERHGVPTDRLHLVPPPAGGSLPDAVAPRPRAALPRAQGYRILFAGRLIDVKGVDHLLRAIPLAAAKLGRPLTLTIAGDGPERAKIEDAALRLGLTVEFAGWVDTEQRSELMRQADLVAVPSLWPEPFGLVGIEAGCFGVPAVGFAVGGIPDWLIPGQSGELAPGDPPTVDGLAEAMLRALVDPAHYQKLRVGAWEMSKQFSLERHLAQLEPLLTAGERPGCVTQVGASGWGLRLGQGAGKE